MKKEVRLLETMPIHGALVSKKATIELDEKEADLLVRTNRAEYVESATKAPIDYKKKKGPDENRVVETPENRGKE